MLRCRNKYYESEFMSIIITILSPKGESKTMTTNQPKFKNKILSNGKGEITATNDTQK